MKLKEVLDKTVTFFKDKKIETPRLDAELLFAHFLKIERIQLYVRFDQPLSEQELAGLRELVRRRATGEPVAYILGYRDFYNLRFSVSPAVLIPRPETEHIIEEALQWAKDQASEIGILDLGTGTGCVGLTLLMNLPSAKLISVDLSEDAITLAKKNAEDLGVMERVQFLNTDAANFDDVMSAYKSFIGKDSIDLFVSNPPYIAEGDPGVEVAVNKFEPHTALYAKDEGLALLRDWSAGYCPYLSNNSLVLMEMGLTQGSAMRTHFENLKTFNEINVVKDLDGRDRVIRGVKHG
ncbi:HemK protein [Bdellovibrio bacteriovorus W]|nr:HemK protein [Bdellovibrio bacteriovorus W]